MAILSFTGEQVGSPTERMDRQDWGRNALDPIPETTIHLPASKSLSNRYLILNALSGNETELLSLSTANDTQLLKSLLANIASKAGSLVLDCEDAGTVWRFLLAFCSVQEGRDFILSGTARLRQRPILPLIEALRSLGAEIEVLKDGKLRIRGNRITSSKVVLDASKSSQFISALMLIAPFTQNGLNIHWDQEPVSSSYLSLTEQCLDHFGVRVQVLEKGIRVEAGHAAPKQVEVERDWSSASYFIALAARHRWAMYFPELRMKSRQGDVFAAQYFRYFGLSFFESDTGVHVFPMDREWTIRPWTSNLMACPDLAPALIAHASGEEVLSSFAGLETLASKESDRIASIGKLIRLNGAEMPDSDSGIWHVVRSKEQEVATQIETFSDHRIAMSAALVIDRGSRVELDDVQCVKKSFPEYWDELNKLGFELT